MPTSKNVNPNQASMDDVIGQAQAAQVQQRTVSAMEQLTAQLTKLNDYFDAQAAKSKQSTSQGQQEKVAEALGVKDKYKDNLHNVIERNYQQTGKPGGIMGTKWQAAKDTVAQQSAERAAKLDQQRSKASGASRPGTPGVGGKSMGQFAGKTANPYAQAGQSGDADQQMMMLAMLGEHGGPKIMRDIALGSYGLGKQLNWANKALDNPTVQGYASRIPGGSSAANWAQTGLTLATENPLAAYMGYQGAKGILGGLGKMNASGQGMTQMGANLGYGGAGSILGFNSPFNIFSPAASEGAAYSIANQAMMGRIPGSGMSGVNSATAQAIGASTYSQGWSMNPASTAQTVTSSIPVIGSALNDLATAIGLPGFRKSSGNGAIVDQGMTQLAGALGLKTSGETMGEINSDWSPTLKHNATSMQQLTSVLNSLGSTAHATQEQVSQLNSDLYSAAGTFESMGSSTTGAMGTMLGFSSITGLDPQIAAQLAQNPMMQGMALSNGILPSDIGNEGSGLFTDQSQKLASMLYGMTAGIGGAQTSHMFGQTLTGGNANAARISQVASLLGIPYSSAKELIDPNSKTKAQSRAEEYVGNASATSRTGSLFGELTTDEAGDFKTKHKLTDAQYQKLASQWRATGFQQDLKTAGLSTKQMKALNDTKNMRDRFNLLNKDIGDNNTTNNVKKDANQQTLGLTPQAAQLVKLMNGQGVSPAKKASNGGGSSIASVINSITGDTSIGALSNTEGFGVK